MSFPPPTTPRSSFSPEPWGRMHKAINNVKKLTSAAACKVKILIGDWFAHVKNKLGGCLIMFNTPPRTSLSAKEKFRIVRSVGEKCVEESELLNLLRRNPQPIFYEAFEPSGRMHIAQAGVMKAMNVKKLTSAGCKVKIVIADWFAHVNDKMGGDLDKIRVVGEYSIEIWKAIGLTVDDDVEFLWSSDVINSRPAEYWPLVMGIACKSKLLRCAEIMGGKSDLSASQVAMYPCMQCADIFFLEADVCQLEKGRDQGEELNVLAREYEIKRKNKPIILSHRMLPGLQDGQEQMNNPKSGQDQQMIIYMDDNEAEVNVKIKKAFCPPKGVEKNPCLEYIKHVVLPWFNEFKLDRTPQNGGDKTFTDFDELVADYASGAVHPGDLKPSLSKALNRILQPVRDHFANDARAMDLFKRVKSFKVKG